MKLSVLVGVTQMVFGICLAAVNHVHFGEIDHLYLEFIPRLLFMLCTFGVSHETDDLQTICSLLISTRSAPPTHTDFVLPLSF
jgi:hypothetical protein